jgi:hypothetical protein
VLRTSLLFRLWKWKLLKPRLFSQSPTYRLGPAYYEGARDESSRGDAALDSTPLDSTPLDATPIPGPNHSLRRAAMTSVAGLPDNFSQTVGGRARPQNAVPSSQ